MMIYMDKFFCVFTTTRILSDERGIHRPRIDVRHTDNDSGMLHTVDRNFARDES